MSLNERRDRWQALNDIVTTNTAERFCSVFLSHLQRADRYPGRPALRAIS